MRGNNSFFAPTSAVIRQRSSLLLRPNTADTMDSEEIIAYVREKCRFYAADIYSWLRVVLDFALDEDELACSEDGATVDVDGRSVIVRSESAPWYN